MSEGQRPPDDQKSTELPPTETKQPDSDAGENVGPYRLLQKLGEGGMGEVWLAEQQQPVRRKVALKIIKRGMDSKQIVARFEAERQALALMDHPAVAKVFDAGTTPRGRPFFVMEYVKGVPITAHCDRHRLSNRERLELFQLVCDGVQHAHQKAIIHRDLKPSNVLVTEQDGKRLPKIIDFGVAKATAQKLTEKTMFTELGVLIGTPEYMSPEQADLTGEDVDTRTDVYSLGVILYELLVGALPFDSKELRSGGFEGIRKKIREEEPHKPSTRLSTLGDRSTESANCRRVDLLTLQRQLRGDLDWITMRALEKDRSRRYASPNELAADLSRHLKHEPVQASPPSISYRTEKFVRRHKVGVVAAAVVLFALTLGIAGTTLGLVRATRAEAEARQEANTSERVSEFLANMLGDVEPEVMGRLLVEDLRGRIESAQRERGTTGEQVELALASFNELMRGVNATDAGLRLLDEQVLARAGQTIEQELAEEPLIAARLAHTIGSTYRKLGLFAQAEPHTLRAVEIRKRVLGDKHPDTLSSMASLASLYKKQGRYDEAEPLFLETLETCKRVLGEDHSSTLSSMANLADLYMYQRRYDKAEPLFLETLEAMKRVLGADHPDTVHTMTVLVNMYAFQGRYDGVEPLFLETLEACKRVLGEDHYNTFWSKANLASLYEYQGRYDEAEPLYLETFEACKRVLGEDHSSTLWAMSNLAGLYMYQRRYDEAEPLFLKTLETHRRVLGDDHPDTLIYMYNMACLDAMRGNPDNSMNWLRQAIDAGFDHADSMAEDSDLQSLHGPDFDTLVERARQNTAARQE